MPILDILRSEFSPNKVEYAVTALLADPSWEPRALYLAVVKALRDAHNMLTAAPEASQWIATQIAQISDFEESEEVESAY